MKQIIDIGTNFLGEGWEQFPHPSSDYAVPITGRHVRRGEVVTLRRANGSQHDVVFYGAWPDVCGEMYGVFAPADSARTYHLDPEWLSQVESRWPDVD